MYTTTFLTSSICERQTTFMWAMRIWRQISIIIIVLYLETWNDTVFYTFYGCSIINNLWENILIMTLIFITKIYGLNVIVTVNSAHYITFLQPYHINFWVNRIITIYIEVDYCFFFEKIVQS